MKPNLRIHSMPNSQLVEEFVKELTKLGAYRVSDSGTKLSTGYSKNNIRMLRAEIHARLNK